MQKRLAILAILAFVAIDMSGQSNQGADSKQQSAKQVQAESNEVGANKVDKQASGIADQTAHDSDSPKWYAALEKPDWWIVVAAFSTLIIISWQSVETRRAAKGAQKAAKFALLQAEHMAASERAWLIVNYVSREGKYVDKDGILELHWSIKNVGNTPAKLLETKARFEVFLDEDLAPADALPVIPDYGTPIECNDRILAPQDTIGYFTKWETRKNGIYTPFVLPADSNQILFFCGFGYVKYSDAFGQICESRSCDVSFINGHKIMDGFHPNPTAPAAYNKCT